jgi:hypothetical protein
MRREIVEALAQDAAIRAAVKRERDRCEREKEKRDAA